MYQDYLVGIPLANPRMELREFWFGPFMPRAFGFFVDPGHYGGYLASVLLLALGMIVSGHRTRIAYAALVCGIPGLLVSVSRGGIIAFFFVGTPLLLLLLPRAGMARAGLLRPAVVTMVSFLILSQILMLMFPSLVQIATRIDIGNVLAGRLTDVLDASNGRGDSMAQHIETRLMALRAFTLHPLLGIGIGNAALWFSPEGEGWGGAHSHHLNMLGESGIAGAMLEWALMWYVARYIWRAIPFAKLGSPERTMLVALFTAYITIILGNFMYEYYLEDFVWFIMGCGLALARVVARDADASVAPVAATRPVATSVPAA
jgi:O-antigen ligase